MNENYITLSLETHLFFARIMKDHSLFLEAGFPCKDNDWIKKAEHFRSKFEELLRDVVNLSNRRIGRHILNSGELVTDFTLDAENKTECLTGVPINSEITIKEKNLQPGPIRENNRELLQMVHRINERSIQLLNGLITFKEKILCDVSSGQLFTTNYPLLIKHIIREARIYRSTIENLMNNRPMSFDSLFGTEDFWNQIMMEHALFIRGLLDPSEDDLILIADEFASNYKKLLEMSGNRGCMCECTNALSSLEETLKLQDFKTAETKGILDCDIASIILPLLADHVLREANHYIRLLEMAN